MKSPPQQPILMSMVLVVLMTVVFLSCSTQDISDLLQHIWGNLLTGDALRSCIKLVSHPFN